MPITFTCACGKQLRAREGSAGRAFNCPSCGTDLVVPGADATDLGIDRSDPKEAPPAIAPIIPSGDRFDVIAGQIERLRRANIRLSVIAVVGPIVAALVGIGAATTRQTPPRSGSLPAGRSISDVIEARGLVIRDEAGRVRATLGYDGDKAVGLRLFEGGNLRSEHDVGDNGIPSTTFYYLDDRVAASIGGGGAGSPSMIMYDAQGDQRTALKIFESGEPILTMSDRDIKHRFQLGVHRDGLPFFDFFDTKGQALPILDEGGKPLSYRP